MAYTFRELTASDEPIVWTMLVHAAHLDSLASAKQHPDAARYAQNWGRPGDMGWVAFSGSQPVGAAWLRLWAELDPQIGGDRGFGHISDDIPELGIAVVPSDRGKGVGTQLLARTLASAQERFHAVSLSVLAENPAVRLYRRMGFEKVTGSRSSELPEHVAFTMVKYFPSRDG